MVVNFAVENYRGPAVFRKDRLITGGKINDLQARRAQAAHFGSKHALLIGSSMGKDPGRALDSLVVGKPVLSCESNDAAQLTNALS